MGYLFDWHNNGYNNVSNIVCDINVIMYYYIMIQIFDKTGSEKWVFLISLKIKLKKIIKRAL